ncbi:hypothetical protein M5689_010586 [Euphorbia peplus]|nr:hypothetical protein M5689_010586 [Euphorbia peplus]
MPKRNIDSLDKPYQVFDEKPDKKLELADFSLQSSDSVAPQMFDEKSEQNLQLTDFSLQRKIKEMVEQLPKSKQTASIGFLELQTEKVSLSITKSYPPYSIINLEPEPLSVVRPYILANLKPNPTFRSPITTSSSPSIMHNPLPLDSDDKPMGDQVAQLATVLIHHASESSLLPIELLERKLIFSFDCEGVNLSWHGTLRVVQIAFPNAKFLVDMNQGGNMLRKTWTPAFRSSNIPEVTHDCKRDTKAVYFQFGLKLLNDFDNQISISLMVNHFVDLLYSCISYNKKDVGVVLQQDTSFWTDLPKHTPSNDQ